jgi:hypothetical protein
MQTAFASISDCYNYISNCIICKKSLHFYIAGVKDKYSFYPNSAVYCKTKIKDCFLISCNKNFPFKINILTNEVLKGSNYIEEMISNYLSFYLKCSTCNFRIDFGFIENKLIDNSFFPKTLLCSEELISTLDNKKLYINNTYRATTDSTFIHYSGLAISLPKINLNKFKNIKNLNKFIKTLLIFN